ncbi:MAG: 50S ribosomal protein L25 [Anaerolineales bacterium]|jgi:large subunit ribosomal protein L25|nr:50S ribosomal protein L25 [Anaerolineales bacterium]
MEQVVLKADRREVVGKHVKSLRREGKLPAILYGKRISPIPVVLDWREASRILSHLTPSSLVQIDLGTEKHTALVREKQRNHLTGALLHVDFQVISMTEVIRTRVSIAAVGESPAVKVLNGILVVSMDDLEVECLPTDLPSQIEVDISMLKEIGDAVHVRDLVLPPKVSVLDDPDTVVLVVTFQEAEEAAAGEAGGEEPEVMTKGKKEEDNF